MLAPKSSSNRMASTLPKWAAAISAVQPSCINICQSSSPALPLAIATPVHTASFYSALASVAKLLSSPHYERERIMRFSQQAAQHALRGAHGSCTTRRAAVSMATSATMGSLSYFVLGLEVGACLHEQPNPLLVTLPSGRHKRCPPVLRKPSSRQGPASHAPSPPAPIAGLSLIKSRVVSRLQAAPSPRPSTPAPHCTEPAPCPLVSWPGQPTASSLRAHRHVLTKLGLFQLTGAPASSSRASSATVLGPEAWIRSLPILSGLAVAVAMAPAVELRHWRCGLPWLLRDTAGSASCSTMRPCSMTPMPEHLGLRAAWRPRTLSRRPAARKSSLRGRATWAPTLRCWLAELCTPSLRGHVKAGDERQALSVARVCQGCRDSRNHAPRRCRGRSKSGSCDVQSLPGFCFASPRRADHCRMDGGERVCDSAWLGNATVVACRACPEMMCPSGASTDGELQIAFALLDGESGAPPMSSVTIAKPAPGRLRSTECAIAAIDATSGVLDAGLAPGVELPIERVVQAATDARKRMTGVHTSFAAPFRCIGAMRARARVGECLQYRGPRFRHSLVCS